MTVQHYLIVKTNSESLHDHFISTIKAYIPYQLQETLHSQISTPEHKKLAAERKLMIQKALKEELGFLVDAPKQGSGNTNDGNMSRKFFDNIDVVSEVTGKIKIH